MCGTCGCDNASIITLTKIGDEINQQHFHLDDAKGSLSDQQRLRGVLDSKRRSGSSKTVIEVGRDILEKNNLSALQNRGVFTARNMLALNLVSSPGAGKTALLEESPGSSPKGHRLLCYRGRPTNRQRCQSNRSNRCTQWCKSILAKDVISKLKMVFYAYKQLDPSGSSLLLIENVGNLVWSSTV